MADTLPTKITKRGNAFSLLEIEDHEEIKTFLEHYSFEGLNIYSSKTFEKCLLLSGECFYMNKSSQEFEFQADIETPLNISSAENITFESFDLDFASLEINIKAKLL